MSGSSGREEQNRKIGQPVKQFSLKGLFNKLTGLLGIRALFNRFARPRGPRPEPVKIDPAWFPLPQPDEKRWTPPWTTEPPPWEPPWEKAFSSPPEPEDEADQFDEYAYPDDDPGWDDEPPEPEEDTITVRPGERVPTDAGELLRTYYAPGVGDLRVYARIDPNDVEIAPDEVIDPIDLKRDFNLHFSPKGPKSPK